jgi:hypothetical protein
MPRGSQIGLALMVQKHVFSQSVLERPQPVSKNAREHVKKVGVMADVSLPEGRA